MQVSVHLPARLHFFLSSSPLTLINSSAEFATHCLANFGMAVLRAVAVPFGRPPKEVLIVKIVEGAALVKKSIANRTIFFIFIQHLHQIESLHDGENLKIIRQFYIYPIHWKIRHCTACLWFILLVAAGIRSRSNISSLNRIFVLSCWYSIWL